MPTRLLLICLLTLTLFSCETESRPKSVSKAENNQQIMERLQQEVRNCLHSGDYVQCIRKSKQLEDFALRSKSDYYLLYASIGLGQSYMMSGNLNETPKYLNQALGLGLKLNDKNALCSVYNGLGLYHTNISQNHQEAVRYFLEGIRCSKLANNTSMYSLLLCNISVVYSLMDNPEGLKYALECLQQGRTLGQDYLIFTGSTLAAEFYYKQNKLAEAEQAVLEAESLLLKQGYKNQASVYGLKAKILAAKGELGGAQKYFLKALSESEQSQTSAIIETRLGYARLLAKQHQFKEAITQLKEGIRYTDTHQEQSLLSQLYLELSNCYEQTGNSAASLQALKKYQLEKERIFTLDKDKVMRELMLRFETEKKERLIQLQQLELDKKQRTFYLQTTLLVLVCLGLAFFFTLHFKREKRFTEIVRQNIQFVALEKSLREQLQMNKYAQSSLTDEKNRLLFNNLQQLMLEKEVYKDNLLTKEKLADQLGTNRTYLSQVINEQTGLSFTHYINNLRIEEARRILSNPENQTPLKAVASDLGFNSLSTFYKAFQSIIGLTPSEYRHKMLELHRRKITEH